MAPTKRSTVFKFLRFAAAGLSAVLCLITLILLVLSFIPSSTSKVWGVPLGDEPRTLWHQAYRPDPKAVWERSYELSVEFGVFYLVRESVQPMPAGGGVRQPHSFTIAYCFGWLEAGGFSYHSDSRLLYSYLYLWLPTLLFAIYPFVVFAHRPLRRRRRLRRGLCLTCGYSLAGNVSGVCPECGGQI